MMPATNPRNPVRDQKPVAIGECQRLAETLGRYPSACVFALEENKDGRGHKVMIALNGPASKPTEYIHTNPNLLLGTFVWCEIRSKEQLPHLQKLIRKVSMLMNAPVVPVH